MACFRRNSGVTEATLQGPITKRRGSCSRYISRRYRWLYNANVVPRATATSFQ